ncbi:MAG TPA: hypothetical protein VHT70_00395 [Candidatus Saccharimonadales bacterium]|jgi:hypothetical protein|nr:hypothetical protein [Candidatus Saccharimonadales bacterium]
MKETPFPQEQQPLEPPAFGIEGIDSTQSAFAADAPIAEIVEPEQSQTSQEDPYPRHMTFAQMTAVQYRGSDEQVESALRGLMPVYRSLEVGELDFTEEDVAESPGLRRTMLGLLRDGFRMADSAYDNPTNEDPWA